MLSRLRVLVVLIALGLMGCSEENPSDNAGSVAGPGVDVHCAGQVPRPGGVGDTSISVICPPP
jgi:hypothetical protein